MAAMSIASRREAGFSLVETIVATALLATAVVTLAQLFGVAVRRNLASRDTTYATILAVQKLEELRAALTIAPDGDPDWDPDWDPDGAPGSALQENTVGWVDYVDQFGRTLGDGETPSRSAPSRSAPSRSAVYIRRWAVQPLPADPDNTLIIQVVVRRQREEAHLVTVKTRNAR